MSPKLSSDLALRTRRLNRRHYKKGRSYVLCWLQQALRGYDNPIIDAAVSVGNQLDLPVVVYHGVDNRYPYASHRLHRFILEASQSLETDIHERRLRFCRYVRRSEKAEPRLVYRLAEESACVFTDDMPAFVAGRQAKAVALRIGCPVFAVDAACAVPMQAFPDLLDATKRFRAAHKPLREASLAAPANYKQKVRKFRGRLCFESDSIVESTSRQLDALIRRCGVDMTIKVAKEFPGNREAAIDRLHFAMREVIPRYKWTRNNPALPESTTKLSPYMHFGVLGPREVAVAVNTADLHAAARWKFLDELLTWREYCYHLARFTDRADAYNNIPEWGRLTLEAHAADRRDELYSIAELLHAQTDDPIWNAAQRQFVLDGWMHNNLRMYWVKQIIKWQPTPQGAWQVACYLNDRLSLDGRDPATYGGIQWGFGRSRKGYREIPVYGWVPPKSDSALRKRPGVEEWAAKINSRKMPQLSVPNNEVPHGIR